MVPLRQVLFTWRSCSFLLLLTMQMVFTAVGASAQEADTVDQLERQPFGILPRTSRLIRCFGALGSAFNPTYCGVTGGPVTIFPNDESDTAGTASESDDESQRDSQAGRRRGSSKATNGHDSQFGLARSDKDTTAIEDTGNKSAGTLSAADQFEALFPGMDPSRDGQPQTRPLIPGQSAIDTARLNQALQLAELHPDDRAALYPAYAHESFPAFLATLPPEELVHVLPLLTRDDLTLTLAFLPTDTIISTFQLLDDRTLGALLETLGPHGQLSLFARIGTAETYALLTRLDGDTLYRILTRFSPCDLHEFLHQLTPAEEEALLSKLNETQLRLLLLPSNLMYVPH